VFCTYAIFIIAAERIGMRDTEVGRSRPVYKNHAYRGVTMAEVPKQQEYAFVDPAGPPNPDGAFPGRCSRWTISHP
jgi:hypothetical protein